jgi:Family of unknown function (DUF5752)
MQQARNPFRFYSRQNLTYLTGKKATNLSSLLAGIKAATEASIYHHTHHFLIRHEFLSPEPPNDFAYWIANILQDRVLGEEVASIDLREYSDLESIRVRIIEVIERFKEGDASRFHQNAPPGEEFHFMEAQSFVFPTNYVAHNLTEFRECLEHVSIHSIYFHVFEARLRHRDSDFSLWLSSSLEEEGLAKAFLQFDPYTQTLENLRRTLIRLVDDRFRKVPDVKT